MVKELKRALLALIVCLSVSAPALAGPHVGQEEIDYGKEAAKAADHDNHILNDEALLARVDAVGTPIAIAANHLETVADYGSPTIVEFPYTFKIVDSDDINAFSIPGGYIYLNKGLINACESDHELAAVIAHEIAHTAHHHMVYLLREESKLEGSVAMLMVASLVGNVNSRDMSNVILGAQFYKVAKVNGYGQRAEEDADLTALAYMREAGYNPVGMLTFLERLAEHPEVIDWGIMQTHPRACDRVRAVRMKLEELGIPIKRRAVTTSGTLRVETASDGGFCTVTVGKRPVCKLVDDGRARAFADEVNALLDAGLQMHEIRVEGNSIAAHGEDVITISDKDAAASGKPASEVAEEAAKSLRSVLFRDIVNDTW